MTLEVAAAPMPLWRPWWDWFRPQQPKCSAGAQYYKVAPTYQTSWGYYYYSSPESYAHGWCCKTYTDPGPYGFSGHAGTECIPATL